MSFTRPANVCSAALIIALMVSMTLTPTSPALAQDPLPGPGEQRRLDHDDPGAVALEVSGMVFADGSAARVILARDDLFADALAGSVLTREGPLLFSTAARVPDAVMAEIRRVLSPGGQVILLGGEAALGTAVVDQLESEGFSVLRLSGATRVETAVAIAEHVVAVLGSRSETYDVQVVRADAPADNPTAAWADSLAAAPYAAHWNAPVLLTPSSGPLHPAVRDLLGSINVGEVDVLGGTGALSEAVVDDLTALGARPARRAGFTRVDTARRVQRASWGVIGSGDQRVVVDMYDPSGWAFGLAVTPLRIPLLGVNGADPTLATRTAIDGCTLGVVLAGSSSVVSEEAASALACGPAGPRDDVWCDLDLADRVSAAFGREMAQQQRPSAFDDLCEWTHLGDGGQADLLVATEVNVATSGPDDLALQRAFWDEFCTDVVEVSAGSRQVVMCQQVGADGYTEGRVLHDNPYVSTRFTAHDDGTPLDPDVVGSLMADLFRTRYAEDAFLG